MGVYPINLELANVRCVVVGGGRVAARKVRRLLSADAKVTVIAPQAVAFINEQAQLGNLKLLSKNYAAGDIKKIMPRLLFCAADDFNINEQAASEGRSVQALVNIATDSQSDFTVPSEIKHRDFLLTVATSGISPAFTRTLRLELEKNYGESFDKFLPILKKIRSELKISGNADERQKIWRTVLNEEIIALVRAGRLEMAEAKIRNGINSSRTKS